MFFKKFFLFLKSFDWSLFLIAFILVSVSLAVQYALSLDSGKNDLNFFNRQLAFSIFGLGLFFFFSFLDYRLFKTYAYPLYFLLLGLLILVIFIGATFRGTKGWLMIGPFNFQVVELGKIILIIVLAKFWSNKIKNGVYFKQIILSLILVSFPFILTLLQPDFGSGFIFLSIWFLVLMIIDSKIKHFIWIFTLSSLLFLLMWNFLLKDYQKERILTYLNSKSDPFGKGYQITQSIIAVGSGKLFGRGLGLGPQSQLHFLPQTKTDFIFSVIAEEMGFIGASLILSIYLILFYRLIRLTKSAYDDFALILILGTISLILVQVIINIGMNIGLIPIVGIPLPLLSYGGSSLVCTLMMLGILQSIFLHKTV